MVNRTATSCGICDAATVNAYVCTHCESAVYTLITRAGITYDSDRGPVLCLLDELDVQISRQSRAAPRLGGRSAETPLPLDARSAKAHVNLSEALTTWARHYGATGSALSGPRRCARWLRDHLSVIVLSADAELMNTELSGACTAALYVIDRIESKDYIGICSEVTMGGLCNVDLYAPHNTATLSCPHCGTVHDVLARRAILLDAAEELLLGATDMARVANTYGGIYINPGMIHKWRLRGKLIPRGINGRGDPMYRVGDVLRIVRASHLHSRPLAD